MGEREKHVVGTCPGERTYCLTLLGILREALLQASNCRTTSEVLQLAAAVGALGWRRGVG